jgi:hypothetical protein
VEPLLGLIIEQFESLQRRMSDRLDVTIKGMAQALAVMQQEHLTLVRMPRASESGDTADKD